MSQYLLFDAPSINVQPAEKRRPKPDSNGQRSAEYCLIAAEQLEKHIQAKHQSADNLLLQPPTRRRLTLSDSLRGEAQRLEQIQKTLRTLANLHKQGAITPELANLTSRAAVERALFQRGDQSAIHAIYGEAAGAESAEHQVLRMEREAPPREFPVSSRRHPKSLVVLWNSRSSNPITRSWSLRQVSDRLLTPS